MKIHAFIPARMASSRFPGKPLIKLFGITMIEHVWRRAKMCNNLNEVFIATCDKEIQKVAENFGAKVIMTSKRHQMCMDRIVEAASKKKSDIIVTIQGDEPLVHPSMINQTIYNLKNNKNLSATTLAQKIYNKKEINDPNRVKIVWNKNKEVLYISREPIPSKNKYNMAIQYYKMVCIYTMKYNFLKQYNNLKKCNLEKIESIDMLRIVENNYKLGVSVIKGEVDNIDTIKDIPKVRKLLKKDILYKKYKLIISN